MKFAAKNYNRERAEELTERLVADPASSLAGVLMNDLLAEFHRGYPLLLGSEQENAGWLQKTRERPVFPMVSKANSFLLPSSTDGTTCLTERHVSVDRGAATGLRLD